MEKVPYTSSLHNTFLHLESSYFVKPFSKAFLTHFSSMFHFTPPENVRKPLVFWHFQGVEKWKMGLKWVRERPVKNVSPGSVLWNVLQFWNVLQISQKNSWDGTSLQSRAYNCTKKSSGTGFFLRIYLSKFSGQYLYKTTVTDCFF